MNQLRPTKQTMKSILILLFLSFSISLSAQYAVKGRVLEESSDASIDFATVVLKSSAGDSIISGTTTIDGGKFEIASSIKEVELEISYIGFSPVVIKDLVLEQGVLDLRDIFLSEDVQQLDEIVVIGDKSTTEFKLDKRVFNVGEDLSTTGASALEVLNYVPSVNVSIEGQISLRGATGVQILIDGKPSVLADESSNALGTITADMIERVEVITNPSAKYEAQGTAGIINIVLKKNEKKGVNGSVSVNTGVPHNHSIGFSLNKRTDRFNLFTQLGVGYRELPSDTRNTNRDFINSTEFSSVGREYRNETFYNVILGSDYYIDPNNVITLSGSFAYEVEEQPSMTSFTFLNNEEVDGIWTREEVTSATNPKLQYELQYKRDFKDNEDHKLLFSAIGNYFGKDQSSTFINNFSLGDNNQSNQQTATAFNEGKYTFILDYTKPVGENLKFETGMQYLLNDVNNDFEVRNKNDNGEYEIDPGLTNIFEYQQNVLGVYGTGAYEGDVWGVKVGLRVENTDLNTFLVNTNEENIQNFTNLFPSFHTSYKLTEAVSFQAGYSRRIFRPRLWDLNPFFNIRNNFNIRVGNPDLMPEFTDSYEVGGVFVFDQLSLNTSVYHRYTTDKVERVSTFDDGVTTWIPLNIGTNKATGAEVNFKYSPSRKITFNGDVNYNVFDRDGTFDGQDFDFSADQWSGKLTAKYKISRALDAEVTSQYLSREQTIQGIQSANVFADFGLRYKILNGKGVFNFSVRDIFKSRFQENTIQNDEFSIYSWNRRGRFVTLGFSYGFGKGEAMQYSGQRRR